MYRMACDLCTGCWHWDLFKYGHSIIIIFLVTVFTLNKHLLVPLLQELNQRLLAAARGGRTEEVKARLRQGAYIDCTDEVRHV